MFAALIPLLLLLTPQSACGDIPCPPDAVAAAYMRGWDAAREAARVGGPPEALAPVREAAATLERLAGGQHGPAEIAQYVLVAAAAAAQEERDEMAIYLRHAVDLERAQLDAKQPGAPVITAHEAAGELWLRVRRYDEAQQAYEQARAVLGSTPLIESGLSRVASARRR